jgi:hypothetical protein
MQSDVLTRRIELLPETAGRPLRTGGRTIAARGAAGEATETQHGRKRSLEVSNHLRIAILRRVGWAASEVGG